MTSLSEKAKGKQRAVEPQAEPDPNDQQRTLTIRFTDGIPDLTIVLEARSKDTVKRLKERIREQKPELAKRRLRLIYSGRLLADSIVLHEWLAAQDAKKPHVGGNDRSSDTSSSDIARPGRNSMSSIRSKGKQRASLADDEEARGTMGVVEQPTWIHCSLGAELVEGEDEDDGQQTQIKPLRGFDRLAMAGFTEDDIAHFRRTFHNSQLSGNYLDGDLPNEDVDYEEYATALEERWIENLNSEAESSSGSANSLTVLLQGLVVGFFFPLLPFFFVRDTYPAVFWEDGSTQERTSSVLFTKRMQLALVFGFITNVMFGSWRYILGGA